MTIFDKGNSIATVAVAGASILATGNGYEGVTPPTNPARVTPSAAGQIRMAERVPNPLKRAENSSPTPSNADTLKQLTTMQDLLRKATEEFGLTNDRNRLAENLAYIQRFSEGLGGKPSQGPLTSDLTNEEVAYLTRRPGPDQLSEKQGIPIFTKEEADALMVQPENDADRSKSGTTEAKAPGASKKAEGGVVLELRPDEVFELELWGTQSRKGEIDEAREKMSLSKSATERAAWAGKVDELSEELKSGISRMRKYADEMPEGAAAKVFNQELEKLQKQIAFDEATGNASGVKYNQETKKHTLQIMSEVLGKTPQDSLQETHGVTKPQTEVKEGSKPLDKLQQTMAFSSLGLGLISLDDCRSAMEEASRKLKSAKAHQSAREAVMVKIAEVAQESKSILEEMRRDAKVLGREATAKFFENEVASLEKEAKYLSDTGDGKGAKGKKDAARWVREVAKQVLDPKQ